VFVFCGLFFLYTRILHFIIIIITIANMASIIRTGADIIIHMKALLKKFPMPLIVDMKPSPILCQ